MPDQITTVAQLSGYPLGAVFTDIEGGVWMIDSRNPATGACWMLSPETVRMSAKHVLRKWGPLTPVWRPDHQEATYAIATLEGVMHASPGDYIIRGVHGEFHPCRGDIFEATYERADTPVTPGQNPGKPTAETVADALIRYETGGCCGFGTTCGLCDCGRADETPEQTQTRDAMEMDRARAILALFPERRCTPSGDEIRNVLHDAMCGDRCEPHAMRLHARMGRAVLALYGDQPTVAQAQAEALRQAARDWSDWDGLSAPEEWLARRAAAIESGADR